MIIGMLFLSGCVTSQYASEKEMCEVAPTWVEYAQCSNRIGMKYYGNDPLEHEMIAYRNLLIEKVQNKQITPTQAEYLRQQKWTQAKQQYNTTSYSSLSMPSTVVQQNHDLMKEVIKNNKPAPIPEPTYKSLKTTTCEPDGLGGVRCTTYD